MPHSQQPQPPTPEPQGPTLGAFPSPSMGATPSGALPGSSMLGGSMPGSPMPDGALDAAGGPGTGMGAAMGLAMEIVAGFAAADEADADREAAGDCQAMIARLYHFLDGELTESRRTMIMGHLEGCPSCFSAYDFEAELRIVVRERTRTHVPPNLLGRIRQALETERGSC